MRMFWMLVSLVATSALAEKPNIIFFIADDMLPRHFNCLPQGAGKNLTPNIDRLAEEGVVMLEQHCASPICTPSRYNVLTGTYASRAQNSWFKDVTKQNGGQTTVEFNTHIVGAKSTICTNASEALPTGKPPFFQTIQGLCILNWDMLVPFARGTGNIWPCAILSISKPCRRRSASGCWRSGMRSATASICRL